MATRLSLSHSHHLIHNAKTNFFSMSNTNLNRYNMPRVVGMAQNQSYWASIEADVQTYLEKAIAIRSPKSVFEPMHHLTFAAPRTSASALCVAACELVGGDRSEAMAAASAVHLMHAAAYIHEHLMDRPKPTIQHKYNPNIELLTGDGIIPFGLELVARSMDVAKNNQDRILRVIIEISRGSGSQGVVGGQYYYQRQRLVLLGTGSSNIDIDYDNSEIIDQYHDVCKKKEGELHACGAACGAILGGGGKEEIQRLRNFGVYVGTLRGMQQLAKSKNIINNKIQKLKALALEELESFQGINKLITHQLISAIIN